MSRESEFYVVQGSHGGCVSNLFQLGQSVNGAAEQRGNLRRIAVPNLSCALGRRDKTRDRLERAPRLGLESAVLAHVEQQPVTHRIAPGELEVFADREHQGFERRVGAAQRALKDFGHLSEAFPGNRFQEIPLVSEMPIKRGLGQADRVADRPERHNARAAFINQVRSDDEKLLLG